MNWLAILTVYVGTGLCFMFFTMARLEIILAVRQSVGHKSPWWFKALTWGLIAGVVGVGHVDQRPGLAAFNP